MNTSIKKRNLAIRKELSQENIEKLVHNNSHWEKRADNYKDLPDVSWGDVYAMDLEIQNILAFIKNGDKVLDVGCSNGYSTFKISEGRKIDMRALDYSKESIKYAQLKQAKNKKKNIVFYHGNALEIEEPDNSFDTVYTIRVIINLLSWELQKKAILEIHRVLKPGGLFLMSEAFESGMNNLNQLRVLAGLPPLTIFDFNLFLQDKKVSSFVKKYFEIVAIKKFSSLYYLGSRLIRPLAMNAGEKDSFVNEINKFFSTLKETDNSGDFGVQKLYVLKKK